MRLLPYALDTEWIIGFAKFSAGNTICTKSHRRIAWYFAYWPQTLCGLRVVNSLNFFEDLKDGSRRQYYLASECASILQRISLLQPMRFGGARQLHFFADLSLQLTTL